MKVICYLLNILIKICDIFLHLTSVVKYEFRINLISFLQFSGMLFEFILPNVSKYLNLGKEDDYQDIIIALLEIMAKERHIEKFKIYTLEEFLNLIKDNEKESNFHSKIKLSLNGLKRIAIENITQVNVDLLNEKLISLLSEEEQENR